MCWLIIDIAGSQWQRWQPCKDAVICNVNYEGCQRPPYGNKIWYQYILKNLLIALFCLPQECNIMLHHQPQNSLHKLARTSRMSQAETRTYQVLKANYKAHCILKLKVHILVTQPSGKKVCGVLADCSMCDAKFKSQKIPNLFPNPFMYHIKTYCGTQRTCTCQLYSAS